LPAEQIGVERWLQGFERMNEALRERVYRQMVAK